MGTEEDIPFGEWLRDAMTRRGYDVDGPRAGGKMRLGRDAGVSPSIISRILNENRVPELATLRAIGKVLGYTLGDMLVIAHVVTPEELITKHSLELGPFTEEGMAVVAASIPRYNDIPVDAPPAVRENWQSYPDFQKMIWHLPGLSTSDRLWMLDMLFRRWAVIAEVKQELLAEVRELPSGRRKHAG